MICPPSVKDVSTAGPMVDNGDCLPPMASTAAESPPLRQIDTTGIVIGVTVGIPAAIGTAALLALARGVFDQTNAALILMIVVVAVAAIGGRTAGMITALAAVASFDFFHTRPYLSLTIDSRDDVETTILLLIAGLIVGTLASSGRRARHEATDARTEIGRIHRVAEAAAVLGDVAAVIGAAQEELRGAAHAAPVPVRSDAVRRHRPPPEAGTKRRNRNADDDALCPHWPSHRLRTAGRRRRPSGAGPRPGNRALRVDAHPRGRDDARGTDCRRRHRRPGGGHLDTGTERATSVGTCRLAAATRGLPRPRWRTAESQHRSPQPT